MSANVTLHAGHDVAYFTKGQHRGGCAGAMSYYTAAGEPAGEWAGKGAAALGLSGEVDPVAIGRLYQHNTGPGGELLVTRRRSKAAGEREQAAVTAYLAGHPYASATELAEVRAAERGQDPPRVPYFDLTVSAVKSVSVLHASYRVSARQARDRGEDDQAAAVPPLSGPGGMVPGPGVGGMPVEPADCLPRRVHQRVLQLIGPGVERGGPGVLAAVAGLARGDPVGGVQD